MSRRRRHQRFQFGLGLIFLLTAATAVQCGLVFGSPLVIGIVLSEGILAFLLLCGTIVVVDQLRGEDWSPVHLAIGAWVVLSSFLVGWYLFSAAVARLG